MENNQVNVSVKDLTATIVRLLAAAGVPEEGAAMVADSMIQANLRGVDSHGVQILGTYLKRIRAGATNPNPTPRVVRSGPAFISVDGDSGLGAIPGTFAMKQVIEGARKTGIFLASCFNNTTFGAAFYYSRMAALEGLIGFAVSNAPPSMAPWGGRKAMLGTNPISISFPQRNGAPIVLDMATSAAAKSKIYLAREKGISIPDTWALDAEGRPTTDPEAALKGLIMPLGGPKGYGLSLSVDLLTGALSGMGTLSKVASLHHGLDRGQNVSFTLAAIDPSLVSGGEAYLDRVEETADAIHACPPAEGVSRIFLPGEPEGLTEARRQTEGIPVPASVVAEIKSEAAVLGVEVDL